MNPAEVSSPGIDESIYQRLRCRARAMLRKETAGHRLEPADLVHEAFLRIAKSRIPVRFQDDGHLVAVATLVMRHILVDQARSETHPGRSRCVPLDLEFPTPSAAADQEQPLNRALERLAACAARPYRVVQLRFFWGLDMDEIASALSVSTRTVKRDWTVARGWLRRELCR
jgi:RNA polymerase sigma factor (TIGR02999 family)